ncbi:unnamed protein product, partial [marine sediment metagenome]
KILDIVKTDRLNSMTRRVILIYIGCKEMFWYGNTGY